MLALGFLVRPANLEAILIHNHGGDGFHAHALTLEEVGFQQEEHDHIHGLEHQSSHAKSNDGDADSSHSEDCNPVVLILGDLNTAQSSARTTFAALHTNSYLAINSHDSCVLSIDSDFAHMATQWSFCVEPPPCRGLSAILQSNHAILI